MSENITNFDVIIVGGGPGGLSALLWCSELGLNAILFEKEAEFGGQLLWTYNPIRNYLGIEAANGKEVRDRFLRQVENTKIDKLTGAKIVRADLAEKTIFLADGRAYSANALIFATGVRRRKLGIPGEEEFRGRGILESGVKARDDVKDKTVVIVGGGDAALENALILGEKAECVFVVHRRAEFTSRPDFIKRARKNEKIEFHPNAVVTAVLGKQAVEAVELKDLETGKLSTLPVDAVLIRIGVEANTKIFQGQVELDELGYVRVNSRCETNVPGIFAVGDVAEPLAPTISGAVGTGASAAKAVFSWLKR